MDHILLAIQQKLETVLSLATIDIDWGQIDEPQDNYPVQFPCALIDIDRIGWEKTGVKAQPGTVQIKITVAMDLLHDTQSGSGTTSQALARMAPAQDVHNALCLMKGEGFTQMERTDTNWRNMYGIKVCELLYESTVLEIAD